MDEQLPIGASDNQDNNLDNLEVQMTEERRKEIKKALNKHIAWLMCIFGLHISWTFF